MSHEMISNITDKVIDELMDWQNRPLKKCYPFIFVDCMYTTVRKDYESKEMAAYTILGYDMDGAKEVLGILMKQNLNTHGCKYLMK